MITYPIYAKYNLCAYVSFYYQEVLINTIYLWKKLSSGYLV